MTDFQTEKQLVARFHSELDQATPGAEAEVLARHTAPDYRFRGVHPFNEIDNAEGVAEALWSPLRSAVKPLQRRDDIMLAGHSEDDTVWVHHMGHFMGLHDEPWLGIPPTGRMLFVRYAEFNQVADGKILQTGLFIDLLSVLQQAGFSPLPAQTGSEFIIPGPRTHDGVLTDPCPPEEGAATLELVNRMCDDLFASYGTRVHPDLLRRTWHEDMIWYGPTGIGSTYTIPRYQLQHQWPFREGHENINFNGHVCRIAEGHYAGWFGWPNLTLTPAGGFMGLPANDGRVDMRVVDVYRREGDLLAENWVFIDLPYYLLQQGVDVLARSLEIRQHHALNSR
ncbi:MAG: ester cyclase [Pseudomonadota bacterium]